MRVLFVSQPAKTIFQYLAPTAWALRAAGHDVRVASQPGFSGVIGQAGLTAVATGRDRDPWRVAQGRAGVREAVRGRALGPYDLPEDASQITLQTLIERYREAVSWWHRLDNVPVLGELIEFARHWRPQLVIWDPTMFAGAIAAEACGAAHGRLLFGYDVFGAVRALFLDLAATSAGGPGEDPLGDWLGGYAQRYGFGFSESLVTGQFTIDQLPESLSPTYAPDTLRSQFVPYGGRAQVPGWLGRRVDRPRVALTMGLSATERFDRYPVPLSTLLEAMEDLDVEVVATVAASHQPSPEQIPKNARLYDYVPLPALAATCTAALNHAGAATVATTALHGVPQLCLPRHFDQPLIARRLAQAGAGVEIAAEDAATGSVREAVVRLIEDAELRTGALALRTEMVATPTPAALLHELELRADDTGRS